MLSKKIIMLNKLKKNIILFVFVVLPSCVLASKKRGVVESDTGSVESPSIFSLNTLDLPGSWGHPLSDEHVSWGWLDDVKNNDGFGNYYRNHPWGEIGEGRTRSGINHVSSKKEEAKITKSRALSKADKDFLKKEVLKIRDKVGTLTQKQRENIIHRVKQIAAAHGVDSRDIGYKIGEIRNFVEHYLGDLM